MSEDLLVLNSTDKKEKYESVLPQIKALISYETDTIANLGNIAAALKQQFGWLWVGFYLHKEGELVLGPFQGPIACTRIQKGKGVCGTAWNKGETVIVEDVNNFPGHIACSSLSISEIVVPIFHNDIFIGVLDADSIHLADFDSIDQHYLEQIARSISF